MVSLSGAQSPVRLAAFCAALLILPTAACDDRTAAYYPLEAGWDFVYRTEVDAEGTAAETYRASATNLAPRRIGNIAATPQLHQDGWILFFTGSDAGVRLVGYQKPGEAAIIEIPEHFILKYPLEPGTKWRAAGRTVLLTERFLYSKALPIHIGIDLDYTVEDVGTDVRVPAGRFSNCVKITGTGHTTVNTADNQRILNVDVEVTEWYAPGVGLVKATRAERAGEERAGNARMVTELEYVKRPSWFD